MSLVPFHSCDNGSPTDSGRLWRSVLLFAIALIPAGVAVQSRVDEDTWWHLRVGESIVEARAVPEHDSFSQLGRAEQRPWVAYSWLYEVGLYGSFRVGGIEAMGWVRLLASCGTVATLGWFLHRRVGPWRALILFALAVPAFLPLLTERPWHATIVGTLLTLHAIDRVRSGSNAWWLVPVFALWANLHIQFVLGLGLLGLAIGAGLVERRSVQGMLKLAIACVLATLLNPYHVRLYGVVWEYATQTGALRLIDELSPPNFRNWWTWPLLPVTAWALVDLIRRRFPVWETALLAVGLIFAMRMQRDLWFGVLCGAAVLRGEGVPSIRPTLLIVAAFALVRIVWATGLVAHPSIEVSNRVRFPVEAVAAIREVQPPGPLFNHLDWGGYLIWELRDYPVWIDGRTNLHGDERLTREHSLLAAEPGWDNEPGLRSAGVIVLPKKRRGVEIPLTRELRNRPDCWRVLHEDEIAVVFVRETPD